MPAVSEKTLDWVWKVETLLLGLIVIPTFGWVWQTNTRIAALELQAENREERILELNKRVDSCDICKDQVLTMGKDIEYMRATIDRIEAHLDRL